MNNYIGRIPNNGITNQSGLTWQQLQKINFNFNSPFWINFPENEPFFAEQTLRVLPKKRLVAVGSWQGKPAVIKLFFDTKAKEKMEKEAAGIQLLKRCNTPTPNLYFQGQSIDQRIYALIFERITAENLNTIWEHKQSLIEVMPLLENIMIELATQHVFGVIQHDLHFKNFLIANSIIYTIDGGQIEFVMPLLSKKISMNNLALFLSQLGVGNEEYQKKLFFYYAKLRGWVLKDEDINFLFQLIHYWYQKRWNHVAKKIFRENTEHACYQSQQRFGMYNRRIATPDFLNFLNDPEAIFKQQAATFLKQGRSSTVIKVILDGKEYVVKRSNIKNFWHRLRRALRMTRAAKSWKLAHKLALFGIDTAKPLAFLEEKYIGWRGKSYYVTEYIPGGNVGDYFIRHEHNKEKINKMVNAITQLLKKISTLRMTHGDLKITNILVDAIEKPVLIDLDGTLEHKFVSIFYKIWHKELKRFLRNFKQQPLLSEQFNTALKEI